MLIYDSHKELAKRIEDDFSHLYPLLFDCYIRCIDTLRTGAAVKKLRSQYMVERGFAVHEDGISEANHVTITRFWGQFSRWLESS